MIFNYTGLPPVSSPIIVRRAQSAIKRNQDTHTHTHSLLNARTERMTPNKKKWFRCRDLQENVEDGGHDVLERRLDVHHGPPGEALRRQEEHPREPEFPCNFATQTSIVCWRELASLVGS